MYIVRKLNKMRHSSSFYPAKFIDNLPQIVACKSSSVSKKPRQLQEFTVDYLRVDDIPATFAVVREAAKAGRNVREDEFTNEESFRSYLARSESFNIWSLGCLEGVIVVEAPIFSFRSYDPYLACVQVVLSPRAYSGEAYESLLAFAVQLTKDLELGYCGCFVSIYLACTELRNAARRQGFFPTACIPVPGRMITTGLSAVHYLFKDFGVERQTMNRTKGEIAEHVDKLFSILYRDPYSPQSLQMPDLPALLPMPDAPVGSLLPASASSQKSNEQPMQQLLLLRNARDSEHHAIYEMFKSAAEKGEGYSRDEIVTFRQFSCEFIANNYVLVLEQPDTGEVVAVSCVAAKLVRTVVTDAAEYSIVVVEKWRGRRIAQLFCRLIPILARRVGFSCLFADCFAHNTPILAVHAKVGFVTVGFYPNATYVNDHGMSDIVMQILDFTSSSSFSTGGLILEQTPVVAAKGALVSGTYGGGGLFLHSVALPIACGVSVATGVGVGPAVNGVMQPTCVVLSN